SGIDMLGNRSEVHLPLTLLAPAKLIGSAQLQPPLFSPNADGAIDTTRLQVNLQQAANLVVRANNVSLYTGPAAAGAVGYAWDGKDGSGHVLADGSYPVTVDATDPNGIAAPENATLTATIDNTPPVADVLEPIGGFASATSSLRVRATDLHFARYDATLTRTSDGVAVVSVNGTQGGDITLSALQGFQEGDYAVHLVARDGAGNVTTRDTAFTLDTTAPVVTLTTPADGALIPSATATSVKGSVNDVHLASYALSVAPGSTGDTWTDLKTGTSNVDLGEILAWTPNLPDGAYRLRLRGVDHSGNTTDSVHAIEIDGTPPAAHISAPVNGAYVRSNIEVDGTATDAHFSLYRLSIIRAAQLAGGQWSDVFVGSSPVSAAKLAALTLNVPEDDYVLRLTVVDRVGLTSTDQVQVRIDNQPPPAPIGLIGHVSNHRDSVLDWTAVTASDLAGYFVYRGGVKITPTPVAAIHYVDAGAPEGRLVYTVTAGDFAGNESAPSNAVTLVVDHTPPTVSLVHPAAGERVRGVYDIVGTAYSHDDFKQYRLTLQPLAPPGAATQIAASTFPVQGQRLASWNTTSIADETSVRVHLEAEDVSGNLASVDVDVVVDNGPPAAPTGLIATLSGADVQTHWNPNSESDLLGYLLYRDNRLVNATSTTLPSDLRPFALTDTQYLDAAIADGTHSYVVYAIDRAGNVSPPSAPATLDPIDNRAPTMTIEQPANFTRFDKNITVLATSLDTDIAQVQFAWRPQDNGAWTNIGTALTSAPYRIVWTPPSGSAYGDYQIRALAQDLGGRTDPAPPSVMVIYADLTPPDAPLHLAAHADGGTVHLSWSASTASDLKEYRVYRDLSFNVSDSNFTGTSIDDTDVDDGEHSYVVIAVDTSGNQSDQSAPAIVHVFSVTVPQPYSPVSQNTITLNGTSARAGSMTLHVDTDSGSSDSNPGATDAHGAIALPLPLALGDNHFTLRVTDANGDISRPAEGWIDHGNVPAAPTGVAAAVNDHDTSVSWHANTESDLLGYRVFRNGQPVAADAAVTDTPTATSDLGFNPEAAVDGDPQTSWSGSVFGRGIGSPSDPGIDLEWSDAHVFTAVNITWGSPDTATGNFDLYAWSGHTWILIAQARGAVQDAPSIALAQPYRTTKLRMVVHNPGHDDDSYYLIEVAEIQWIERPVQSATSLDETLIDGTWNYQVSALSNFAFESPLSTGAVATV
ncbi:MAG TPA: Ig-like domain-containing protein, partial [Rudaea sp.]